MKLKPEVFERAAAYVVQRKNDFCCSALQKACAFLDADNWMDWYWMYHLFMSNHFQPEHVAGYGVWWRLRERRERVLALLLCAEMCRKPKKRK